MAIIALLLAIIVGVSWYRIAGKAGFSPWLGLLMLLPLVNIAFLLWFAFTDWPIHRQPDSGDEGR
ncbi:hypothetical protein [Natronospira bacteriovora]|uniref:DUF805 domain-containing protein n=1 Tax=Natronospira bacteriovora TaxID=3069753 RepID=A0ABU0W6V7_9GAMM|nr:hypothetical protein [Natronospira sp. AB-CW4]MDQ2069739.1 hypothetical protein [Natronospira sp. AB-CW4]